MIAFKKRTTSIREEMDNDLESGREKKSTNSQTVQIEELNEQLASFSLGEGAEVLISPEKIIGMFYQRIAARGDLCTIKKMECIYAADEMFNKHKGWALGMAVAERQIPVVIYILSNPGNILHNGHIKYAIQRALETDQNDLAKLLSEFNQNVTEMEVDRRKLNPS
jgi:hypothetical protein